MVCYPHLFKNFPQFVVILTVKGFSIVNEMEVNIFLGRKNTHTHTHIYINITFLSDPVNVGYLILDPLSFLNPAWISQSSGFT